MKKREYFIDIAKSIGIFLVVLGHTEIKQNLKIFIYSFHMPLFFIISGFLFKMELNFKEFFTKRFKRLILPYFIFSFLTYIFWIFFTGKYGIGLVSEIGYLKPIIGTILGLSHNDYLVHNVSLWFLYVLFLIELIYFFISKINNKILLFGTPVILTLLGYFVIKNLHIKIIYGFEKVLIAQLFYFIGVIIRKYNFIIILNKLNEYKIIYLTLISFIINQILNKINGFVDLVGNLFGNYFIIYFINGIIGSFFIIFLSILLEKLKFKLFPLEIISKSTLYILGFHEQFLTLIFGIIFLLLKIEPHIYKSLLTINIIFSILICIGISFFKDYVLKKRNILKSF